MNQPSHQPKAPLLMQEQVAPIPPKKKPKRKLFDYKPREILLFFLLFIPLSVMLIPFLYMVSISIKTDGVVLRTLADILPRNPSFDNYATVLANGNFARYLGNSLFVSSSIVIGNVFFLYNGRLHVCENDVPREKYDIHFSSYKLYDSISSNHDSCFSINAKHWLD